MPSLDAAARAGRTRQAFWPTTLREGTAVFSVTSLGLLAGMMLGIFIAGYAARGLPPESWILRFQLENRLFTKTMPPALVLPLIGLVLSASLASTRARLLFAMAAALTVIVLIVTMALEVPINNEIASWTAGAAPSHWIVLRDRWLRNHLVRTLAGILAFAGATIGLSELRTRLT